LELKGHKSIPFAFPRYGLIYFFVFAAANTILSYSPLVLEAKLWVFLFGVLVPFVFSLRTITIEPKGSQPIYRREVLSGPPRWLWIILAFLAVLIRLLQTCVPGYWPLWDDGRFAYYSAQLANRWSWNFFFSPTQHPPLFNWSLGLFFKALTPSLFSLWLYPALCSITAFILCCVVARSLFPKSFAFLCCFLMAFSFWPLYTGRFCIYMAPYLAWEMLVFALLAVLGKVKSREGRGRISLVLGLCLAVGFWVAIAWPVVALAVSAAFLAAIGGDRKHQKTILLPFLVINLISVALFVYVSLLGNNGAHIQTLWALKGGTDLKKQSFDSLSNVTALFWGCDLQNSYGPVWGGVLNPIFGSFFFIGLLEGCRFIRVSLIRWIFLALPLFLLPGIFSKYFDIFRNTQAIPLLLWVIALGVQSILTSVKKPGRQWLVLLMVFLGAVMDVRHLWLTYQSNSYGVGSNTSQKTVFPKAYEILKTVDQQVGPGVILFDLQPNVADQTLTIATYSFNAACNPKLSLKDVKWMAVMVNSNYQPFLAQRFHKGKWFQLSSQAVSDPRQEDEWMMGIIPIEPEDRPTVVRWAEADKAFRKVVWFAANVPENRDRSEVFQKLPEAYLSTQGDPMLESLYWEMVFDFHRWENIFGDKNTSVHFPAGVSSIRNALKRGYPTAYFYNEWGGFLMIEKNYKGAREAFLKAINSKVNFTPAQDNLRALDRMTGHGS